MSLTSFALGTLHRHLSSKKFLRFIETYNSQSYIPDLLVAVVDSNISPIIEDLFKKIKGNKKLLHYSVSHHGLGYHLNKTQFLFPSDLMFRVDFDDELLEDRFIKQYT